MLKTVLKRGSRLQVLALAAALTVLAAVPSYAQSTPPTVNYQTLSETGRDGIINALNQSMPALLLIAVAVGSLTWLMSKVRNMGR